MRVILTISNILHAGVFHKKKLSSLTQNNSFLSKNPPTHTIHGFSRFFLNVIVVHARTTKRLTYRSNSACKFSSQVYIFSQDFDEEKKIYQNKTQRLCGQFILILEFLLYKQSQLYGTDSEILILCVQDFAQSFRQSNYHHLVVVN